MEFPGFGKISLEPPPEELKSFMKKKIATWIRMWALKADEKVSWAECLKEIEAYVATLPDGVRENVRKDRIDMWRYVVMCGQSSRDIVTEEEVLETWMKRIFDREERKIALEINKKFAALFFEQLDLNKDGFIDFPEFVKRSAAVSEEAVKTSFDTIDDNKDGIISAEEWLWAISNFLFCSGPDSPYSHLFGQVE